MGLVNKLNWSITAAPKRFMKRLRKGRYEGKCKDGKRVRIDQHDECWELYLGQKFVGKYPLKRLALDKANAILRSDECDEQKQK